MPGMTLREVREGGRRLYSASLISKSWVMVAVLASMIEAEPCRLQSFDRFAKQRFGSIVRGEQSTRARFDH